MILDAIAGSRFSYDAGASGTVTVPAGVYVTRLVCRSTSGGTLTITPNGSNQTGAAGAAIPIIANAAPFQLDNLLGVLGPGTLFVFVGTDSYYVEYAKMIG